MKEKILTKLHELIDQQIANAKQAMDAAQEASMGEDKSSAGDKFETGRAMAHRDRDMYAQQLAVALNEKEVLYQIGTKTVHNMVSLGSFVETSMGMFFISISMGKMVVDGKTMYAISLVAPICGGMLGKRVSETFMFQNKEQSILGIG
jgi:hypothetical protein